ncbi:Pre-mRNA-splicing factor CWC22 [Glycine max]|nr:Pre-mRNA-splicing factor CWC22 [Glycine max]
MQTKDETQTNLINLLRKIYLTIMSSVDFEEAGHELLKIKLKPDQEMELCIMLLECCSQKRKYLRYYGLLGQQYSMIHRLETNKLGNVAKFFAHLLGTDALPWRVLSYLCFTEEDTNSPSYSKSPIFLNTFLKHKKPYFQQIQLLLHILFQKLSEHLGIWLLNERLNDQTMLEYFESMFPKDNPKNTRFCINFFTSIGLGDLIENLLREYLKNMPCLIMQQQKDESGSSDSSDYGTASSEKGDSACSDESDSENDRRGRKRRRKCDAILCYCRRPLQPQN